MSKLKSGKAPFETYYSKIISQPVVKSCPYHKPYTAAYLSIISVVCYLMEGNNKRCGKSASEVLKFLEKEKYTDGDMDVYNKSVLLFSKIIRREIAPRGDWFFYDLDNENLIQRLYLCFGDLINNPDCINDYVNAPTVFREVSDQVRFTVEFDEVFCLTLEYMDSL